MITDEPRKYTEEQIKWLDMTKVHYIDEECAMQQEDAIDETLGGLMKMTDEKMAENGWVRLPLGVDGIPIHIGDVMDSKVDYLFDGRPFEVRALVLCEDGWKAADSSFGNRYEPNSLRHHHELTVEDVLREFAEKITDSQIPDVHPTYEEAIVEYAQKLQLKEE